MSTHLETGGTPEKRLAMFMMEIVTLFYHKYKTKYSNN